MQDTKASASRTPRINPRLRGHVIVFAGYDGRHYTAHVESVRNGVAKLLYQAYTSTGREWVNAYIDDPSRINPAQSLAIGLPETERASS